MLKAIIIDDEMQSAEALKNDLIINCPSVSIVQVCFSAKEGALAIKKQKPDLVFLDIEMPWMNGFEMLELIEDISFSIIFTTAHDQYAVKAFRISAIDYLMKPIDASDLKKAVSKVEQSKAQPSDAENIKNLLRNIRQPAASQKIAFPQRDGYQFTEVNQIVYCLAEGAYTKVCMFDKKNLLVSKSLGDIEELLPPDLFQRIHHSIIINLTYITQFIRKDGGYVILTTGDQFAVSKSRRQSIMDKLGL